MAPYIQRMIEEKKELDERIGKLLDFYDRAEFGMMSVNDKLLMMKQGVAMARYTQILGERIYNCQKKGEADG